MKNRNLVITLVIVLVVSTAVYALYSPTKSSEEKCDQITGQIARDECYYNTAVKLGDENICNKIYNSDKSACIKDVAIKTKNDKLCAQISSQINRDKCYLSLAIILNDESLCNKLYNADKSACIKEVVAGN